MAVKEGVTTEELLTSYHLNVALTEANCCTKRLGHLYSRFATTRLHQGRSQRGGGAGGLAPPPRKQRQKISVSCRSTEYGCDVVYIRKRCSGSLWTLKRLQRDDLTSFSDIQWRETEHRKVARIRFWPEIGLFALSTVYIYLFWKGSRGRGLSRTVGDWKQIGVELGPAHQALLYVQFLATPLRAA